MRADRHAVLARERHGRLHRRLITRMRSAGDVRRRDDRHQFGIVPRAFAEIAIKINAERHSQTIFWARPSRSKARALARSRIS